MKKIFIVLIVTFLCSYGASFAKDIPEVPAFTSSDRVLVLAPHPDDEVLGTGGVIQRALAAGAKVKVVCYTNGDHNEFAFIVYEKRLTFRTGEFLHMGEVRRKETVAAMASLGLKDQDLVFLGYPDFGTMAILTQHWQDDKPCWSLLTRICKVSYPEALSPGAPYEGESILKDLKTVLEDFKPNKIFVSHPADTNRDHQSLYIFLRIALWDLEKNIGYPSIYPYIIHVIGWPKPRGHHIELAVDPPPQLSQVAWERLTLTEQESQRKQGLISFFPSQIEYNPSYLYTYARKNELFGDFSAIRLQDRKTRELVWHDVAHSPEAQPVSPEDTGDGQEAFASLEYALNNGNLYMRLTLHRRIDKDLGVYIDLLGYNKQVSFAQMPKINISIGLLGMSVKNKGRLVAMPQIVRAIRGRSLIVTVPLANLNHPQYIVGRVRTRVKGLPLDASAWRVIQIE